MMWLEKIVGGLAVAQQPVGGPSPGVRAESNIPDQVCTRYSHFVR